MITILCLHCHAEPDEEGMCPMCGDMLVGRQIRIAGQEYVMQIGGARVLEGFAFALECVFIFALFGIAAWLWCAL